MGARGKKAKAKENLGISLIRDGDYQGALKELIQAAELDPENADIQNALGTAFRYLGLQDKAIIHLKKALELKPEFPEAQVNLGTVYADLKKWDLAAELFEKAAGNILYRARHFAFFNLGRIFQINREYKKAIDNYKKAVNFSPRYSHAYFYMGISYEMLKDWNLASDSYKKSIEIQPNRPEAHLHLGKLYLKLNRHGEAAKELIEAINTDSKGGPFAREARRLLSRVKKPH